MKTKTTATSQKKNIDLFVSGLSGMEILNNNEMICVRGGDALPVLPPMPPMDPPYPKK